MIDQIVEQAAYDSVYKKFKREQIKRFNKRKKQRRAYCGGRK
jgi:hypothetical protein